MGFEVSSSHIASAAPSSSGRGLLTLIPCSSVGSLPQEMDLYELLQVCREMLLVRRSHIGEVHGELSPVGGVPQCSRGTTPLPEQWDEASERSSGLLSAGSCLFCHGGKGEVHNMGLLQLRREKTSGDGEVPLKRSDRSDQKCLKEPEISMEWQIATGIGSGLWGISKGSHVLLLVCCCACRLPNSLMPAVASELFQDCLPLLFCSAVLVWFCVGFVFFQNKRAECSMLAAINIQIKDHCVMHCPGDKEKQEMTLGAVKTYLLLSSIASLKAENWLNAGLSALTERHNCLIVKPCDCAYFGSLMQRRAGFAPT
ncbi:glucose-fructose oxidoreductase domain-containing protein 1 isoform 2-T3 [Cyanocitta cristata]